MVNDIVHKHNKQMQNDAFQYDTPMKLLHQKNNHIPCNVELTHLLKSLQFRYYNTLYEQTTTFIKDVLKIFGIHPIQHLYTDLIFIIRTKYTNMSVMSEKRKDENLKKKKKNSPTVPFLYFQKIRLTQIASEQLSVEIF